MIIDGTARDYDAIARQYQLLNILGYDCYMVFVETSLEIAQARNMERARKLKPDIVETYWRDVQKNKESYRGLFSSNFQLVNNNDTLD